MVTSCLTVRIKLPLYRTSLTGCLLIVLSGLTSCGSRDGIERFELSGKVLYDGNPVPKGYLRFVPDRTQGNRGPGASATIRDGQYQTLPSAGFIGGPHVVKIVGNDGVPYKTERGATVPVGRPLFPEYEIRFDFPRESGTHDFEIPLFQKQGKKKNN